MKPDGVAGVSALIARDRPFIVSEVHPEQLAPATLFAQLAALRMRPRRIVDGRIGPDIAAAEITGVTTVVFTP